MAFSASALGSDASDDSSRKKFPGGSLCPFHQLFALATQIRRCLFTAALWPHASYRVTYDQPGTGSPRTVAGIGDDVTDEDAFAALEEHHPDSVTVRVGPGPTSARFRLPDVASVMEYLRRFDG